MLNLRQIGAWALGALGVVLILALVQSSLDQQMVIDGREWSVFPRACLIAGEMMLATWFLGTAVRKPKPMPPGFGHAGIGLILAGISLSGILLIGELVTRY
jgi:hypothetical protein